MSQPLIEDSPYGREAREALVFAALDATPGQDLAELEQATGLPTRLLAPLLWRLEDERRVVHEGRRWFTTP